MATGYSVIFFAGLFLLQSTFATEDHWGYPNRIETDTFPKWGGLCDSGTLQSPIDLSIAGSLKGSFPEFDFDNYYKTLNSPALVNNGHTIQLSQFSTEMVLSGGPLADKYIVEQVHLHWWSEHTIDKIRYPLEAHIVHRNQRYANFTEAVKHKDGITVIGVLFHASNEPNSGIEKIVENIEFINNADEINKAVKIEQKLNLRELFPDIENGYLTYEGSLTTPSCAEVVTWIVLLDTSPVTMEQVNRFKNVEYETGHKLVDNYRNIQKKNNRAVLVVQGEYKPGAAPSLRSSMLALTVSMGAVYLRHLLQ